MKRSILLLAVAGLFGGAIPAGAASVAYTFDGAGTGTIGGTAFTNAAFTITVDSDTNLITPFSFTRNGTVNNGFSISPSPASIAITGIGTVARWPADRRNPRDLADASPSMKPAIRRHHDRLTPWRSAP